MKTKTLQMGDTNTSSTLPFITLTNKYEEIRSYTHHTI